MNRILFTIGFMFTIFTFWIGGLGCFTWGGTNVDYGADVIIIEGGILISGSQKNSETIEDDVLLLNLSLDGTTTWARLTNKTLWDRANCVIPLASGDGYAYAGYCGAASSTWDYLLGKTNASGNTIWTQSFGTATKHERANALAETMNGGFIVVGNNETDIKGWMLITDENGSSTDSQTFNYAAETCAWDIITTPVNHHLVIGTQKGANADVMLVMLNVAGMEIWHQSLGGTQNHYGLCGNNATDGFIIGGYHKVSGLQYNLMLMKANESGEMQWLHTYDLDEYEQFNEVRQAADGGFIAVGSTGNYAMKDWCIFKTDAEGNELWHRRIGGDGNDECLAVNELANGSIVAVGATESYGAGQYDIWVNIFNADGTEAEDDILPHPVPAALSFAPNPFRDTCQITMKGGAMLCGAIYNLKGEKVFSIPPQSGDRFTWNGCDDLGRKLPSGVYYTIVQQGTNRQSGKLVLMR